MTARAFESVHEGLELPPAEYTLTRGDLVQYAGVSGDLNPIHWSDAVVRAVGLKDVVAHGMLSMGLGATYVTSWLGDPSAVREYSVRFTSPVYVPDDGVGGRVEFTGRIKSVNSDERTAVIALVAKSEGKKIFGRALATVQLT
ncbi:(3R)-hydroxyacyl-ACP dehydratase subunit HadB [Hoyosella sp. YIM 151337]|uniref:(3R)-hydroxyacyl-ACP dehydratase subunit HadB n=1 Tax=Hoyosella sp. YIM 151337 TaxID=2992742 RepID=UPI0022356096|nr:(3R)-hydroxyacyl-ACP dehydratase subunit HadB [Hoyosella sp. YIM 151337]MCW4352847.1 (3R)-hydroxyacyl-ACP dehydratase subunit HadB [Hoyosella sp. YIM 151337]